MASVLIDIVGAETVTSIEAPLVVLVSPRNPGIDVRIVVVPPPTGCSAAPLVGELKEPAGIWTVMLPAPGGGACCDTRVATAVALLVMVAVTDCGALKRTAWNWVRNPGFCGEFGIPMRMK